MEEQGLFIWGEWEAPKTAWTLSDDTQLTLASCEAILAHAEIAPDQFAHTFLQWYQRGKLSGLGSATLQALRGLECGGHWSLVGKKGEQAAGNGTAMRIAPLAFVPEEPKRDLIRDICRISHHNEEAYVGALAIYWGIRFSLFNSNWTSLEWMAHLTDLLPDSLVKDRMKEIIPLFPHTSIGEIAASFGNSGYVVESVPLAVYTASQSTSLGFEESMKALIDSGGDTDTHASMFGQLFGAKFGKTGLPVAWQQQLSTLEEYDHIDAIVQRWRILYG